MVKRLLIVGLLSACSARPPAPAPEASVNAESQRAEANQQLVSLKHQFLAGTTPDARGYAAALLVRRGERDPRYWTLLARSAETALAQEVKAAARWRSDNTVRQAGSVEELPAETGTGAKVTFPQSTSATPQRSARVTKVYGSTTVSDLAERSLDLSSVGAILNLAVAGDKRGSEYFYRALDSDNVLLAAQGALGLAKVHDEAAVDRILSAARRFPQSKILFAQALTYFNNPEVQREAEQLVGNSELYNEMRRVAQENGYDPYPNVEED